MAASRLRYAALVSRNGPAFLHGLIQGEAGLEWRQALVRDVSWMQRLLRTRLGTMPHPRENPEAWEAYWIKWPVQWHLLVKSCLAQAVLEQCASPDADAAPNSSSSGSDEWMCGTCAACFGSHKRLALHRMKAHGIRAFERDYVVGTVCPFCSADFHSRLRVLKHLKQSGVCGAMLYSDMATKCDPHLVQQADAADAAIRKRARQLGRCPNEGPPMTKPRR